MPNLKRCASFVATLLFVAGVFGVTLAQDVTLDFEVTVSRVDTIRTDDGERAERLVEVREAVAGEIVQYDVNAEHVGDVIYPAGRIVVSLPIAEGLSFVPGSASSTWPQVATEFSVDGATYHTIEAFPFTPEADTDPGSSDPTTESDTADTPSDTASGQQPSDDAEVIEPSDVRYVRWTVLTPFEPEQTATFTFRVEVQ